MKKRVVACLFIVLCWGVMPVVQAQRILWDVDFLGFFDNREYTQPQTSQTLFGTRLTPQVGLSTNDGRFSLMAGASWVQAIDGRTGVEVLPIVYFRHQSNHFQMSFGLFPRTQLIEQEPDVLVYDSLIYYEPNLKGALFQYQADRGYVEAYIDWRGIQSHVSREAFSIALKGRYNTGIFFLGGNLMMNHLARTKEAPEEMSVMDDFVINPFIGIDLSQQTILDSLSLKTGYQLGMQRNRGIGKWHKPQGFLSELVVEWRFLGVKNILYAGENQYPFYPVFGGQLNQGDPYYQSKFYNRTNIYAYLFRTSFVNALASINVHCTEGGNVGLQQQLVIRMNINQLNKKDLKRKSSRQNLLKNIF